MVLNSAPVAAVSCGAAPTISAVLNDINGNRPHDVVWHCFAQALLSSNYQRIIELEVRRVLAPFLDHRSALPQAWQFAPLRTLNCGPVWGPLHTKN